MKNSSNVKSLQYWGLLTFWNQRFATFNNLGLKPQAIDKYIKNPHTISMKMREPHQNKNPHTLRETGIKTKMEQPPFDFAISITGWLFHFSFFILIHISTLRLDQALQLSSLDKALQPILQLNISKYRLL